MGIGEQNDMNGSGESPYSFEHRVVKILKGALDGKTTVHLYGAGFHLIGLVSAVNDSLVEMRMGDKTIVVRFDRIDAVTV